MSAFCKQSYIFDDCSSFKSALYRLNQSASY